MTGKSGQELTTEVSLDQRNWLRSPDSSFAFTITPPFWRRLWFLASVAILFFLAIYVYIRFRVRSLEREKIILEEEVLKRTMEIRKQNTILEEQKVQIEYQRDLAREQKEKIEAQKEEIQSSIHYAHRIQSAVLPSRNRMDALLKDYFILSKPCEIGNGDQDYKPQGKLNKKQINDLCFIFGFRFLLNEFKRHPGHSFHFLSHFKHIRII